MGAAKAAKIFGQVQAQLDELATTWIVEGPASVTEQRLVRLAHLAAQTPELKPFAQQVEALASGLARTAELAEEPFTSLRALLKTPALEVEKAVSSEGKKAARSGRSSTRKGSPRWKDAAGADTEEVRLPEPTLIASFDLEAEPQLSGMCDVEPTLNPEPAVLMGTQAKAEPEPRAERRVEVPTMEAQQEDSGFENDPEMLAGFVTESEEHLAAIEEQALQLERDPGALPVMHAIFRGFHTIKGLAGFLGLRATQAVAHEVETLLDHARNGRLGVDSSIIDLVLESAEYLKSEVVRIQASLAGRDQGGAAPNDALLARIATTTAEALRGAGAQSTSSGEKAGSTAVADDREPKPAQEEAEASVASVGKATECLPATVTSAQPTAGALPVPSPAPVEEGRESVASSRAEAKVQVPPRAMRSEGLSGGSIRVETAKLDHLMDMVGEMVIAQSLLCHNPNIAKRLDARLAGDLAHLARATSEVQRRALSMRMMPIGPLFQKNAKLVRELSRKSGKQVDLSLSGEATELDKTIAEELSDPLLHMIRNAMDHGIEGPEERVAAGKSPVASLRLSAEHQSGKIVISIADDGRGLNAARILARAKEKGLVEADKQMPEHEIYDLIFAPGFSTAEKITDISGRGVGMDVVRKHVETLRGRIQIETELGKGTTFNIHLPLTLAIIEGLVIVVGDHRYIIPIFSVREMFRPTREMLATVQGAEEMILMRGKLYPLVRLHRRFGIRPRSEDICQGLCVLCESSTRQFCLFIDDLIGRQEIVIKSLGDAFADSSGLAGCAILGDGRIGLILDVAGIYKMHNMLPPAPAAFQPMTVAR